MRSGNGCSPASIMKLLAAGAATSLALLALASPETFALVVRGGEPMHVVSRERLDFLRIALATLALAALAFCVRHSATRTWDSIHRAVFAMPFAALAVVAAYKLEFGVRDPHYLWIIREDGPVEYATAIVCFIASGVAAHAGMLARDTQARPYLGLFALAMLFIALSEISF
jgi:hypothetical protein